MASSGNQNTTRSSNQMATNKPLVGIRFPFRKGNGEFPERVRGKDVVQSDLLMLFSTPLRSRVMRPVAGHNAELSVFESQGPLLNAILQRIIRQTVLNNEPRAQVTSVDIQVDGTKVDMTLHYVVQGVVDSVKIPTIDTAAGD